MKEITRSVQRGPEYVFQKSFTHIWYLHIQTDSRPTLAPDLHAIPSGCQRNHHAFP